MRSAFAWSWEQKWEHSRVLCLPGRQSGEFSPEPPHEIYVEWGQGEPDEDRLAEVMEILQHDGYLRRQQNGSFVFESGLLRDWWQARFGSWN